MREKPYKGMKFAIIAAGEGARLSREGVILPKPMVRIDGTAMIDRLVRIFTECGATEIALIINDEQPLTKLHSIELQKTSVVPIRLVIRSTPSSMHSFYELSRYLHDEKFCLTTVDTIFRESEFKTYIANFIDSDDEGWMAVTDYIDDEKPLYVATDDRWNITGFYDTLQANTKYVSGGIYCLKPSVIETLQQCMEKGMVRMRNFQRQLIEDGRRLKAYPFSKILDVDHAGDIGKAEVFLKETME